jgi:hypothetical protein
MMMSRECLDLVGEAFKLKREDLEDKGGDLIWRLARAKVRGGDPYNKGKEDVGAIFKSHYNGDTEPFETVYAKCLEDAWKEWNEEKAGDAADLSAALNALEDERAAEQQTKKALEQSVQRKAVKKPASAFSRLLDKSVADIEPPDRSDGEPWPDNP